MFNFFIIFQSIDIQKEKIQKMLRKALGYYLVLPTGNFSSHI